MRRSSATILLSIAIALAGCAAENRADEKPPEDDVPVDGKVDSFRSPTDHGQLIFGTPMRASLSDDELFHAWGFELSQKASIELDVASTTRLLDTVMYLYQRESDDEAWGRYIDRNDDDGDEMTSAIRGDYGAGQYRIIIKGYKRQHQGAFSISGRCDGEGCAVAPDPDGIEVPAETGFSAGCVHELWTAMGSTVVNENSFSIDPEARTGYDRAVLVATAHYADLSDWREYVYPDEEFLFDVEYIQLENGALVEMADGGDESTTDYAFDSDGNLLAYYVHNQSPWTGYYCADAADEEREEPTEDCVSAWINHGPRAAGSIHEGSETYSPDAPNDEIDSLMRAALRVYVEDELDGEDTEIAIDFTRWESPGDGQGAELLLASEVAPMVSYTVIDNGWDDAWVVFSSSENDDEGMRMVCQQQ